MKRFITYILLVILALGLVSPGSNPVSAKSIAELEKELQELKDERSTINSEESDAQSKLKENEQQQAKVQAKINQLDGEIFATESNIASKQEEINVTNGEIQALENSIAETEDQIEATEAELEELANKIEELIERIEERDVLIKNRLRSMQHSGGSINYLQVLFGAQSFGDFINRATAVSKIHESDRTIMSSQERDKSDLEDTEVEVEEKKDQLVADKAKLDAEKDEVESKRATLVAQQQELSNLQAQLNQQRDSQVATANELEDEYAELEEYTMSIEEQRQVLADQERVIKKLMEEEQQRIEQLAKEEENTNNTGLPPLTGGGDGSFIWPAAGRLTSKYGWREFNGGGFHYGIDIANSKGTTIIAAASGYVTRSSYSSSYGHVIYIYHPNMDKTTVYAHLDSRGVSLGDAVSQGQQIGTMGDTGISSGDHLHFEIQNGHWSRHGGIDPMPFLP
ncbi:M23 family metallopeptidase [Amphibacillus indicireducens]|uniref:M23 family metallopeptidase n=2 Tax=Amphibacillus indicireducens TaxID=1076330 RepID=A0ABP7VEV6_9BACI